MSLSKVIQNPLNEFSSFLNETSFEHKQKAVVSNLVISIFTAVSLYLFLALLYHKICSNTSSYKNLWKLLKKKKYGLLSKHTCICIAVSSLIRLSTSSAMQALIENNALHNRSLPQSSAALFCSVLPHLTNISADSCRSFVILLLWFRQSKFYVDSSVKMFDFKFAKLFSYFILIFFVLLYFSHLLIYVIVARFEPFEGTYCINAPQSILILGVTEYSWILALILMQFSLLGLFIYPICKFALWKNKQQNYFFRKNVIKAAVLATICCLTYIFVGIAYVFAFLNKNYLFINIPHDIHAIINQFITICYFDDWSEILWPWSIYPCFKTFSTKKKSSMLPICNKHATTTHFANHTSIKEIRSSDSHQKSKITLKKALLI